MAKKTSIKVRLVPESKPDSPFYYYVKKNNRLNIKYLRYKKESNICDITFGNKGRKKVLQLRINAKERKFAVEHESRGMGKYDF